MTKESPSSCVCCTIIDNIKRLMLESTRAALMIGNETLRRFTMVSRSSRALASFLTSLPEALTPPVYTSVSTVTTGTPVPPDAPAC